MLDIIAYKNQQKKDMFNFFGEIITCPERAAKAKKFLQDYYNNFEEMHLKKQKVQIMKNGPLFIGETAKNAPEGCTTVSTCAKIIVTQQAQDTDSIPKTILDRSALLCT